VQRDLQAVETDRAVAGGEACVARGIRTSGHRGPLESSVRPACFGPPKRRPPPHTVLHARPRVVSWPASSMKPAITMSKVAAHRAHRNPGPKCARHRANRRTSPSRLILAALAMIGRETNPTKNISSFGSVDRTWRCAPWTAGNPCSLWVSMPTGRAQLTLP
jgi:hypothetical protein